LLAGHGIDAPSRMTGLAFRDPVLDAAPKRCLPTVAPAANMCIIMHMSPDAPDALNRLADDDCEVACIHPAQVRAARAGLAAAPPPARIAALFAVLGDATRTRLLTALASSELCVCDLAAATGINRTTVSHQLRVLREHRIVRRRRDGKVIYYALDDSHVATLLSMGAAHAAEAGAADAEPARSTG